MHGEVRGATASPGQARWPEACRTGVSDMSLVHLVPLLVIAFALLALALPQAAKLYKRRRRMHLVLCPDTETDALVRLGPAPRDAHHCTVKSCSEWPRRRHCSQECARGLQD